MKILQLGTADNGGCTFFMADALTQHTDYEVRALRTHQSRYEYPGEVVDKEDDQIRDAYEWADVVHLHDEAGALVRDLDPKPTVVTYHGTRYRKNAESFNEKCEGRGWIVTVSTIDLTQWGAQWLPTPRRDMAHDWQPAEKFVVVHAPTNRERKRTNDVIESVPRNLMLIENQPYRKCLQRKARGRVLVDGWYYGYGNNGIEAWALGMPVVAGASLEIQALMIREWGYLPFVPTSLLELPSVLEWLQRDLRSYIRFQRIGRAHFLKYHHAPQVAEQLMKLYGEALG